MGLKVNVDGAEIAAVVPQSGSRISIVLHGRPDAIQILPGDDGTTRILADSDANVEVSVWTSGIEPRQPPPDSERV